MNLASSEVFSRRSISPKSAKTFHIQSYNEEGEQLLGKFELYMMSSNEEFFNFLDRVGAKGLERINDSREMPEIITSLERVKPGEYYRLNATHLQ